jgi:hypothetical protein
MGMFSMTSNFSPRPKLRVTCRSSTPFRPHEAQTSLDEIDRDDDERSAWSDLDEGLAFVAGERGSADERLDFPRLAIALAPGDFAREDDVFEVEDGEIVIVKLFRGMQGNDVVQRPNAVANVADRVPCHWIERLTLWSGGWCLSLNTDTVRLSPPPPVPAALLRQRRAGGLPRVYSRLLWGGPMGSDSIAQPVSFGRR